MYKLSLTLRQHLIRFFFLRFCLLVFHNHVKESLQCIYSAETQKNPPAAQKISLFVTYIVLLINDFHFLSENV